jgi:hypothetical protein
MTIANIYGALIVVKRRVIASTLVPHPKEADLTVMCAT